MPPGFWPVDIRLAVTHRIVGQCVECAPAKLRRHSFHRPGFHRPGMAKRPALGGPFSSDAGLTFGSDVGTQYLLIWHDHTLDRWTHLVAPSNQTQLHTRKNQS